MKNLEIKHLAPYLPYGLRIEDARKKQPVRKMGELNDYCEVTIHSIVRVGHKPLLHPLSRLTQSIKVEGYNDGEEFVPMEELREVYTDILMYDKDSGFYQRINESLVRGRAHDEVFPFNQLEAYSYHFKWKIDVFGFQMLRRSLAFYTMLSFLRWCKEHTTRMLCEGRTVLRNK